MVKTDKQSCKKVWGECDNPKMKNACTVVALSMVTGIPVHKSLKIMDKAGRKEGYGFYSDAFFREYPVVAGHKFIPILGKKDRKVNVERFIKKYPTGTYYVATPGHAFMIRDGVVFDHTERGKYDKLNSAFKIEPTDEPDSEIKTIKYVQNKMNKKAKFDEVVGDKWRTQSITFKSDAFKSYGGDKFEILSVRKSGPDDYSIRCKGLFKTYVPAFRFYVKNIDLKTIKIN